MITKAVKEITTALEQDKGLYEAYQANIAMAFVKEEAEQVAERLNAEDITGMWEVEPVLTAGDLVE